MSEQFLPMNLRNAQINPQLQEASKLQRECLQNRSSHVLPEIGQKTNRELSKLGQHLKSRLESKFCN